MGSESVLRSPFPRSAERTAGAPKNRCTGIRAALNDLAALENPQSCVKKLKGHEHVPLYSYRIGTYRAILTIDNGILVIFVITIDHRGTVSPEHLGLTLR